MKKVFSSHREVCHIWASRSQNEGHASSISFENDVILSYQWWPMAKFISDNIVLMRNWNYSNSTAKHMNYVSRAIPDYYKVIYCNDPGRYATPHTSNIECFVTDIKNKVFDFKKSLKYKQHVFNSQQSLISELSEYCKVFDLSVPDVSEYDLNTEDNKKLIELQAKRLQELEIIKETKRQKLIESVKDDIIKLENDWINGETNQTSIYIERFTSATFSKTRLRVKDDNIQTSLGANVPIRDAQILYNMIQRKDNIKGHQIGHYTVIGINGTLKIGCHEIERDEITRLATLLNW